MTEQSTLNAILRTFGTTPDLRIWRANTGSAVPWEAVSRAIAALKAGRVVDGIRILQGRTVQFGVPGQADLTGLLPGGRRLEIETKSPTGVQRKEQRDYQAMIERFGGLYILARSADDVQAALREAGRNAQ